MLYFRHTENWPGNVLCTVLVNIPWVESPSLVEFQLIDNNIYISLGNYLLLDSSICRATDVFKHKKHRTLLTQNAKQTAFAILW